MRVRGQGGYGLESAALLKGPDGRKAHGLWRIEMGLACGPLFKLVMMKYNMHSFIHSFVRVIAFKDKQGSPDVQHAPAHSGGSREQVSLRMVSEKESLARRNLFGIFRKLLWMSQQARAMSSGDGEVQHS